MTRTLPLVALAALSFTASASAESAPSVWAVSDGEKIERDDLASPLKARNAVWDGHTVHLAAARNEIVAFQVIVESGADGIRALSASLPELRRRGGTETIAYARPASDPSLSAGRPIQLFSVHYMNVTAETHATASGKPPRPRPLPATRRAGSPSSSCPRTRARAAAASRSPSGRASARRSGSRCTSPATSRPGLTRGR